MDDSTSILNNIKPFKYSLPINIEFPNAIAFSGVKVGLLLSYASSNFVVVLVEGKGITSILKGHDYRVCTVAFENHGCNIISCDIQGNCIFWHFQDSEWQKARTAKLGTPATCIEWMPVRREIIYSSKDGLIKSNVSDFGVKGKLLCKRSEFCAFNYDGSLLASHYGGKAVTIFFMSVVPQYSIVIRHNRNIILFDFHPNQQAFMTITDDYILRIWKLSVFSTFNCASIIKVPFLGRFVRLPFLATEKKTVSINNKATIAFVDGKKIIKMRVNEDCTVSNIKFDSISINRKKMLAAYKTNLGSEAFVLDDNSLEVISKNPHSFLIHGKDIIQAQASPFEEYFFTRDVSSTIIWPFFDQYRDPIILKNIENAVWINREQLIYLKNNSLYLFDLKNNNSITEYSFPDFKDFKSFFVPKDDELYVLTCNSLISKNQTFSLKPFEFFAFSPMYSNNFLLITTNDSKLTIFLLPLMRIIPCDERSGKIEIIMFLSFSTFVIYSGSEIEFWVNIDDHFKLDHKIKISGIKNLYSNYNLYGSELYGFDGENIYDFTNGISIIGKKQCTMILITRTGHFILFNHSSFEIYPFCYQQQDFKQIKSENINYIINPYDALYPSNEIVSEINATLFYLLEFSQVNKLINLTPKQIPALPNQYPILDAISKKDNLSQEYIEYAKELTSIKEDIDLFGLRYILSLLNPQSPPSYFGLWCSFSSKQSQIVKYLSKIILTVNLSHYFIPLVIHSHNLLEEIVKAALVNTWNQFKVVDNVALYYIAMGNKSKVSKLYGIVGDLSRSNFFVHDFKQEKWRKSALINAYSSLSHQNYEMAAALFILGGDITSAISVIVNKIHDLVLGFLILRLLEKSNYKSKSMIAFLKDVKWNDDISPILVSNLIKEEDPGEKIKEIIFNTNRNSNISIFGDRRIALFEIYSYLTKKIDVLNQLAYNLLKDGLIPLSNYLINLGKCPYIMVRSNVEQESKSESDEETSDNEQSDNEEKINDMKAFDFGYSNFNGISDDEYDSEWSDSSSESSEIIENKVSENKEVNHKNTDEIHDVTPNNELFTQFLYELSEKLANIFQNGKFDEITSFYAVRIDKNCNHFKQLSQEFQNYIMYQLSIFIDFCSILYLLSISIPLTPKKLLDFCLILFTMISNNSKISLDLNTIKALPNNGFVHSILFGSFSVSMWTFSHELTYQLLCDTTKIENISSFALTPCSLFDVDFTSPRFVDSIPLLLVQFSQNSFSYVSTLERNRLLIMFLIFKRFLSNAEFFTTENDQKWLVFLLNRFGSMIKSLKLYQISLSCAPFDTVTLQNKNENNLLTMITKDRIENDNIFKEIQEKSLLKLPDPPIFKNNLFSLDKMEFLPFQFEEIKAFSFMPYDNKKLILIANKKIIGINLSQQIEMKEIDSSNHDIFQLIPHPQFQIFLGIGVNNAILYDFQFGMSDYYNFSVSSHGKINNASFSPTGSKIAICSNVIDIFQFDLSKWTAEPIITKDIKHTITASAWINSDTLLAFGYLSGNAGKLIIFDILTDYEIPIDIGKDIGYISKIEVDHKRGILIISSINGFVVLCDLKKNYEPVCCYNLGSNIVSSSSYDNMTIVGTESNNIIAFNLTKTDSTIKLQLPFKIVDLQISHHIVIAGSETKLAIWKEKKI